jgi:hypothetical protein
VTYGTYFRDTHVACINGVWFQKRVEDSTQPSASQFVFFKLYW